MKESSLIRCVQGANDHSMNPRHIFLVRYYKHTRGWFSVDGGKISFDPVETVDRRR